MSIPPGYKKIIRARMEGELQHGLLLCTPCTDQPVVMADSVLEVGEGGCVNLIVENHSLEPAKLKKGTILGEVAEVEEVERTGGEVLIGTGDATPNIDSGAVNGVVLELCEDQGTRVLRALDLSISHLTSTQQQQLRALLQRHCDVFALDSRELGTASIVTHVIDTGNHAPIRQPVRRTPFALRAKVDELVADMLDQGVVQPSSSPWASPIVLVQKKDGSTRFCVDYRKLNQISKLDEFPLPRIDDTLDLLAGTRYFTTLDLASGFWQVSMDKASQEKTAFTTHAGLYEFQKMPFGLANAPATFQRLMEVVLHGLAREVCFVYLDDIVVVGATWEEHLANLTRVLDRIRRAGLKLKPKKCEFAQAEVLYLDMLFLPRV